MRTATKSRLAGGFIAAALVAAGMVGGAPDASSQTLTCQSAWNDSAASGHCSDPTIMEIQGGRGHAVECDITVSCSFEVTYGSGGNSSVTVTPSLALTTFRIGQVPLLTVCVTETTDSSGNTSYSARIAASCDRTNEYSAGDVAQGQFHDD